MPLAIKSTKRYLRDKNRNGIHDHLDWLINACAIILPFTTLDQLYLIYVKKETAGVSALTWFLYGVLSIPLLLYAIKRKDLPMILLNGLWVVFDLAVWIGALLY